MSEADLPLVSIDPSNRKLQYWQLKDAHQYPPFCGAVEKSQNFQKLTWSHRVKKKSGVTKNGGIESDNLKTGAISKYGIDVKMIKIMLDGCLDKKVL